MEKCPFSTFFMQDIVLFIVTKNIQLINKRKNQLQGGRLILRSVWLHSPHQGLGHKKLTLQCCVIKINKRILKYGVKYDYYKT